VSGFSTLKQRCADALPTVVTFIPKANRDSLTFLLASSMLGRFLVGAMRCVADYPTLNTKEGDSNDQKVQTFSERLFMEGLGVPAGFLFIALGQDAGFKIAQKLHPQSHPKAFLEAHHALNTPDIQKAFLYTFNQKMSLKELQGLPSEEAQRRLNTLKNPLHKNLFEAGKQHRFVQALEHLNPDIKLPSAQWKSLETFFRSNNLKTNSYAMLGGLVFSTLFSGIAWQWLNDGLLRKKIEPPLVKIATPLMFQNKANTKLKPDAPVLQPNYAYASQGGMRL
jgi:hypothetical protein